MKHQEKKYRVESLAALRKKLLEVGAKKEKEVVATHYYVKQEGSDVTKLVIYSDRSEIHVLEEVGGKFSLKEKIPLESKEAGLQWLKDKGHRTLAVVKMTQTDYEYKGGIVGLYVIDDFLHSVILDFPEGQHEVIEEELGLNAAGVISVPYNKFLEQIGRLHLVELN